MYTLSERVLMGMYAVLFLMVLIGGVFTANAVSMWLANRREERRAYRDKRLKKAEEKMDQETANWIALVNAKSDTITALQVECRELQRRLARMEDLLAVSEQERRKLMEEKKA